MTNNFPSSDSTSNSPLKTTTSSTTGTTGTTGTTTTYKVPEIPIEIVSEEEMALIESAFAMAATAATRFSMSSSSPALSQFRRNFRSIDSITFLSKKRLPICSSASSEVADIEDSDGFKNTHKRIRGDESLFYRFRRNKGLSVTDFTATEWCEKQMEFTLQHGKPKATRAMKAGSERHAKLEEEVVKTVKIRVETAEDRWALKLLNFIVGVNQLLFEGLTREVPILGFVEGVWIVGVIDEIRIATNDSDSRLILVDTKTRSQDTLPAEPQRRNGRLQLMLYKYLWDRLASTNFSSKQFFDFYSLNPYLILSEGIRESTSNSGFPSKTLNDMVRFYKNTCNTLPMADDQLVLRYESQNVNSLLLGEDKFPYDHDFLKSQIDSSLEFWRSERQANYVPEEELWKCRRCNFASICPSNTGPISTPN